jgi:hypothetical protein
MRTWNVMDARMARVGHRAGAYGMRWMLWLRTCYVMRTQQIPTGNPSDVTGLSDVSAHSLHSLLGIMGVAHTLYIALILDQVHYRSVPLHYCKAAQALADLCTCKYIYRGSALTTPARLRAVKGRGFRVECSVTTH